MALTMVTRKLQKAALGERSNQLADGSSRVGLQLEAHNNEGAVYSIKGILVEKWPSSKDLEYGM